MIKYSVYIYIYIVQYSLTPQFASSFKVYINRLIIKFIIINVTKYITSILSMLIFSYNFCLSTAEGRRVLNLFKFNIRVFDFALYIYIIFQYVTILGTSTG